jgi:hypothetical protein
VLVYPKLPRRVAFEHSLTLPDCSCAASLIGIATAASKLTAQMEFSNVDFMFPPFLTVSRGLSRPPSIALI